MLEKKNWVSLAGAAAPLPPRYVRPLKHEDACGVKRLQWFF